MLQMRKPADRGTVGGSGPAMRLIHGYAESSRMWKPLAQTLALVDFLK
jgi:hypothetical protein